MTFNPEILQTRASLARFLDGSSAVQEVLSSGPPARLSERWDASILEVAHYAAGIFLTAVSYLLDAVCLSDLSKRAWVASRHEISNSTVFKTQRIFQQNLLAGSINTHRKDTADLYLQPPVKAALPSGEVEVNLFNHKGLCRGMCNWFLHLYFKTQGRFANEEAHIAAVGRQFESGASREAAFLQTVPAEEVCNLLGGFNYTEHAQISTRDKTHLQLIGDIQNCPQGIYGLYLSHHQLLYIKTGRREEFIVDPSRGALKIDSLYLFKNAMEGYFETHDHTRPIIFDRYTPR